MRYYVLCLSLFVLGCTNVLDRDMIALSQQNETIVKETTQAVASTIKEELSSRDDLTAEQKQDIQNLLDRLSYMEKSSEVIKKYFSQEKLDVETVQEIIRSAWRKDALQK